MKCRGVQAVLITVLAGLFVPGLAQKNYYVVVGAFSTEENEKDFTTHLPSLHSDTAYLMTNDAHVVHLFVLRTDSRDVAIAKSEQLKNSLEQSAGKTPLDYESIFVANSNETKKVSVTRPMESRSTAGEAASSRSSSEASSGVMNAPEKAAGKLFKFTIANEEGHELEGKIHYVDFEQERDLATYPSSVYTRVINPGTKRDVAVVCGMFGYRQTEKILNYADPSLTDGAYRDEKGAWVVPYNLERLAKGDVSVMYNVAFHKDAAILLPESHLDLEELVRMMTENRKYEITIHGHCNGKHNRKIIAMGNKPEYFTTQGSTQFFGTAKELSALRAEAIRKYLVLRGIDEKRIRTYAWGGRYKLVEPDSEVGRLNDRIEIEIRKD
jgi:outer membrane protein OmpA-like peptidoglycan-associated protein